MKPGDAVTEIRKLLDELARRGGSAPSSDLTTFIDELSLSPGLKAVRKSTTSKKGSSASGSPRVGAHSKRTAEADMSKTIDELASRLREAFDSDQRFESVLAEPITQKLSKSNVVTLYNRVFAEARPLAKGLTKPEVFNAIRRERINRVRSGY